MTLREIYASCFNIDLNIEVFVFDELNSFCHAVEEKALANFIYPYSPYSSGNNLFDKYKDIEVNGFRLVDFEKNRSKNNDTKFKPIVARKIYVFTKKGCI